MAIIDDRTSGLNLPLPNPDNFEADDCLRLREALGMIDAAILSAESSGAAALAAVIGAAPATLDTLVEIANSLGDNPHLSADLIAHVGDASNPHATTKAQVGLGNCDNTPDPAKPVSTAQAAALALKLNASAYTAADVLSKLQTVDGTGSGLDADLLDGHNSTYFEPANANIQSHISNTSNPHSTTKAQVGLGKCDNTEDTAKPVSTAQATAIGLKLDTSAYTAADVLTKIKTVDGATSGLDADLFQGSAPNAFATASHTHPGMIAGWTNQTASAVLAVSSANRFATVGQTYTLPATPLDGDEVITLLTGTDVTNVISANTGHTLSVGQSGPLSSISIDIFFPIRWKYIAATTNWVAL